MVKVADYISKNICVVRKLVKNGLVPIALMCNYDVYNAYLAIEYEESQMKKYAILSNRFKISISQVRRAIKEMEKPAN